MMRRGVALRVGAVLLVSACAVLAAGCQVECERASDCEQKKGAAPEGQRWVCTSNSCRTEAVGEEPDGGQPDAGQPDAGQPDAGPGTVAKGGACATSVDCQGGLRCEAGDGGASTCQAMHLAITLDRSGGAGTVVAAVRYDEPEAAPAILADQGKWPRWDRSGSALAFVALPTGADGERLLAWRQVVPAPGEPVVLTDGGTAGTGEFNHLEWGPGEVLVWTRSSGTTITGIHAIPTDGGMHYAVTENGGFPSFSADGQSIAYSNTATGLLTAPVGGGNPAGAAVAGGEGGFEPFHGRATNTLLYRRPRQGDVTQVQVGIGAGASTQPLYSLYSLPAAGGTPVALDEAPAPTEAAGGATVTGYWVSYPTLSDDGTLAAYTRTKYTGTTVGSTTTVTLQTNPNDLYVLVLDPATGAPKAGSSPQLLVSNAVQPSISPDGRFVAYVQGAALTLQEIAVGQGADGGTEVTKVGNPIVHTGTSQVGSVATGASDDGRPRWQPR